MRACDVYRALAVRVLSGVILACAMYAMGIGANNSIFHVGKSTAAVPVSVFGVSIDTDTKWWLLIAYLVVSEALLAYSQKIYGIWYSYSFLDPRNLDFDMGDYVALAVVNAWAAVTFVVQTFTGLLIITAPQMQFLVPGFLARQAVSAAIDLNITRKKRIARLERRPPAAVRDNGALSRVFARRWTVEMRRESARRSEHRRRMRVMRDAYDARMGLTKK